MKKTRLAVGVLAALVATGVAPTAVTAQARAGRPATPRAGTESFAAPAGRPLHLAASPRSDPDGTAGRFLTAKADSLGTDAADLVRIGSSVPVPGLTVVRYQQRHGGLPVIAGQVTVTVDGTGGVLSAQAATTPATGTTDADKAAAPARITAAAAVAAASAEFRRRVPKAAASSAGPPVLSWYDPALLHAPGRADRPGGYPVWQVDVRSTTGDGVRRRVFVDAADATIALSYDNSTNLRTQVVCDGRNDPTVDYQCTSGPFVRKPGDPASAVADANKAWDNTFATYDFYHRLGIDLADLIGTSVGGSPRYLRSTVRVCAVGECPLANAVWDGREMVYGAGYAAADDVVGHEMTHGVTEHTSGLAYYQESGAINESMSDVFGELIDLSDGLGTDTPAVRWKLGEELPDGAVRDMRDPTMFGQPDRMTSANWNPNPADQGGVHQDSGVGNKAAQLIVDGGTFNGQTMKGLGVTKTAKIYWEVEHELTSGADYSDLFRVLQQSCRNLAEAGAGVSAADCVTVTRAVTATEMDKAPTTVPTEPARAGVCPSGTVRGNYLVDDFEGYGDGTPMSSRWILQGEWVTTTSGDPQGGHVLHGVNAPDRDATLTLRDPVALASGVPAYLRFSQLTGLLEGGARVEVSRDAKKWTSAAFVDNGYNGKDVDDTTPVFTGESHRWFSSRADLSAYAGTSVYLRLRLTHAQSISPGWWVDDLAVYGCGDGTPSAPGGLLLDTDSTDTTASVLWTTPSYLGSTTTAYQISAAPGGATVVVPPQHTPGPFNRRYFHGLLPGLRQGADYTLTVRGRVGNGGWGRGGSLKVAGTRTTLEKPGKPVNGKLLLTGTVTFATTGKPAGVGTTINIDIRRPGGPPDQSADPAIGADGRFSVQVPYQPNRQYQALTAGDGARMGSVSQAVVVA